jgi:hypothetical protein
MFRRVHSLVSGRCYDTHLMLEDSLLRVGWQIGIFISDHDDDSLGTFTPFKLAVGTEVSTSRGHAVFAIECHTDSFETGFLSVTCATSVMDRFLSFLSFILNTC